MLRCEMSMYLLAAAPIAYVFMLVTADSTAEAYSSVVKPLLRGIVVWIVSYLVYLFVSPLVPLQYDAPQIYGYYAFHDFGYWTSVGIVGFLLVRFLRRDRPKEPALVSAGAFFLGVFLVQPVIDLITFHKVLNAYHLFLLPTLRILLVYAFASLISIYRDFSGLVQAVVYIAMFGFSLLLAFVPMLFTLSYPVYAYLLAVVLAAGVALLYLYALHAGTND